MNLSYTKYKDGLVPAVVQDHLTKNVLMLGFMNAAAVKKTEETGRVTFFSRSKERLWTKGEESGNYLNLVSMLSDCDNDTLLITVKPEGPVCHKGTDTCWGTKNDPNFGFLSELESIIEARKANPEDTDSYVATLIRKGINKVAQKVGEEAVELVIEAKDDDDSAFIDEAADLMFHLLILMQTRGFHLSDLSRILESRHKDRVD